jgi:2-oxoglutarate ferredoxin oxidoreductase subunit gamma
MAERYEVRFSGTGGQGVVLAGMILAEAAGLFGGKHVVQTVSYGPQVRGGNSNAEVVISQEEIDHPRPLGLDLLVPFTQQGCDEGARLLKPKGVVLLDPELVSQMPEGWVAALPLRKVALEATGRVQMANVVSLGAVVVLCPHVDLEAMVAAVRERAPRGLEETFIKALEAGYRIADSMREKISYQEAPSPED